MANCDGDIRLLPNAARHDAEYNKNWFRGIHANTIKFFSGLSSPALLSYVAMNRLTYRQSVWRESPEWNWCVGCPPVLGNKSISPRGAPQV